MSEPDGIIPAHGFDPDRSFTATFNESNAIVQDEPRFIEEAMGMLNPHERVYIENGGVMPKGRRSVTHG